MKHVFGKRLAPAVLPVAASALLLAAAGGLRAQEPVVESPALAVRPPRQRPSVPGLPRLEPQPVPGVGELRRAFSPCLSADLKTIVFANWFSRKTEYDLYIATREKIDVPFGPAELIKGAATPRTDAYPALSADGLELVYLSADDAHLEKTPKLLRSTRPDVNSPFSQAEELPLPLIGASRWRISNPQFLDKRRLKFCLIQSAETRSVRIASRSKEHSPFKSLELLPLENHWPLWWVSADGLRAYTGIDEGICLANRNSTADEFGPMEAVVPAKVVGKIDGPIWLAPQEDVAFYCSPGEQGSPDAGRHLMMVGF
ncbi:MAG TPA: hypothetical protein VMV10_00605 [Pirellulales bacterium]|nr:hypothetical protein [Pirellulales bacterium]